VQVAHLWPQRADAVLGANVALPVVTNFRDWVALVGVGALDEHNRAQIQELREALTQTHGRLSAMFVAEGSEWPCGNGCGNATSHPQSSWWPQAPSGTK
jgi:hypothetical protein